MGEQHRRVYIVRSILHSVKAIYMMPNPAISRSWHGFHYITKEKDNRNLIKVKNLK
jgi:hypothetical protein